MATKKKLAFGSPEWRAKYLKGKRKTSAKKNAKAPKKGGKKNWIASATKDKGALHKALGIPVGQVIPLATLKAAAAKGGKVGMEARLAITLRNLNK